MKREEAVAWLAGLFDEPLEKVSEATARESIYGWDSLGTLTLMAEMDEKFDIQLSEKDVTDFLSVGEHNAERVSDLTRRRPRGTPARDPALKPAELSGVGPKVLSRRRQD